VTQPCNRGVWCRDAWTHAVQFVAVCCSILQYLSVYCNVLDCVAERNVPGVHVSQYTLSPDLYWSVKTRLQTLLILILIRVMLAR